LAREEELFEEETGEEAGVVADDAMLFEEIIADDANAELEELVAVEAHGVGIFGAITARNVGRNGLGVGDDDINDATANMFLDGSKMITEGVVGGFARLGHQIGDVNAWRFGMDDGAGDFGDQ
jgi:hypothetical protein